MSKGTLLYLGGFELPDKNAAALRVMNIGKLLKKRGFRVVYVGIDHNNNEANNVLETKCDYSGFECYSVRYPRGLKEWINYESSIDAYLSVFSAIGDVDGVILYNFPSIAMNRLVKWCHRKGKKCYADITEWNYFGWNGFLWGAIKGTDTWLRMHVIHKKMDGLIVISRYLERYYRNQRNVVRIPILADTDDLKWNNNYHKSKETLYLVYAGNAKKKDRLDYLVEAIRGLRRSVALDVIGVTKEEYISYYPFHREFLESVDYIRFHGRLEHKETIDYIKKANYSCFFRKRDRISQAGFPTKFVEALCCGTPVITNDTSDLSEFIVNGKNGIIVDELDSAIIRESIERANYEMPIDLNFSLIESYLNKIDEVFK